MEKDIRHRACLRITRVNCLRAVYSAFLQADIIGLAKKKKKKKKKRKKDKTKNKKLVG
jgi:hypothetical protein